MALDFPDAPVLDDVWTGANGVEYTWDGTKWVGAAGGGAAPPPTILEPVGAGTWGRLETSAWEKAVTLNGDTMTGRLEIVRSLPTWASRQIGLKLGSSSTDGSAGITFSTNNPTVPVWGITRAAGNLPGIGLEFGWGNATVMTNMMMALYDTSISMAAPTTFTAPALFGNSIHMDRGMPTSIITTSPAGVGTNQAGGTVTIWGGDSDGSGTGGGISLRGGMGATTASPVTIEGGRVRTAGAKAGELRLSGGYNTIDFTHGKFKILALPTAPATPVDPDEIWNNAGVLNIGAGGAAGGGGMTEPVGAGQFGRTAAGAWENVLPMTGGVLTGTLEAGTITTTDVFRAKAVGMGVAFRDFGVYADNVTGGVGRTLNLYAGDGDTGGPLTARAGNSTLGNGGMASLNAGNTAGAGLAGGAVSIAGGMNTGAATTAGIGGNVNIKSGTGPMSGSITIAVGNAIRESAAAGSIAIDAGNAMGVAGSGGATNIRGGSGGTRGGDVALTGGTSPALAGDVTIYGGVAQAAGGTGGSVTIQGGNNAAAGQAGSVMVNGSHGGVAGAIPGIVALKGGDAFNLDAAMAAGNITLTPGLNFADPTKNGLIILNSLPVVAQTDPNALWNNAGVLSVGAGGSGGDAAIGLAFSIAGIPASNAVYNVVVVTPVLIAANLAGSYGFSSNAATASAIFTVRMILAGTPTDIGNVSFGAGATTPTFTGTGGTIPQGGVLQIRAPSTPDATLADFAITIGGTKV